MTAFNLALTAAKIALADYDQHDIYRMPQAELKAHLRRVIDAGECVGSEKTLLKQLEDETAFYADTLTLEYHVARIENAIFLWTERPEDRYRN